MVKRVCCFFLLSVVTVCPIDRKQDRIWHCPRFLSIWFSTVLTDWLTDVADTYDALHLLHSFQSRNTSASTVFLIYCGLSGLRRSQSWWCLAPVLRQARVALYARFFMAVCLLLSACSLDSLVVIP